MIGIAASDSTTDFSGGLTKLPFDTARFDPESLFDNGNDRLVVPAGVTKVELRLNVSISALITQADRRVEIWKNGSATYHGNAKGNHGTDGVIFAETVETGILDVAENDYFEVFLFLAGDSTTTISAADLNFTMTIVETTDTVPSLRTVVVSTQPKWRGARIRGQSQSGITITSFTKILFDLINIDTDSVADLANERLVVPAGVSKVKLHGQLSIGDANTDGNLLVEIRKNGSSTIDGHVTRSRWERTLNGPDSEFPVSSGTLTVVEGDYFELWTLIQSDTLVNVGASGTWLELEIVEFNSSTDAPVAYIAIPPEHKGALIVANAAGPTMTNSAYNDLIFYVADYDTSFDPGDGGPPQRFWLGPNWTFVDGDVSTGNDTVTETAHGYQTGEGPVTLTTTGTLPTGLALPTKYWIIQDGANTVQFATSRANALAGTQIDITGTTSGTHTVVQENFIVVPANVAKMKFSGFINVSGSTGDIHSRWVRDGAVFDGGGNLFRLDITAGEKWDTHTAVVEVSEGERFSLQVFPTSGIVIQTTGSEGWPWISCTVVEESRAITYPGVTVTPPKRGALIGRSGTLTANFVAGVEIDWDSEISDPEGFHEGVTNPNRLTIPTGSGITKVKLSYMLSMTGVDIADFFRSRIQKNGAAIEGLAGQTFEVTDTGSTHFLSGAGHFIDVVDGDYFGCWLDTQSDTSTNINAGSWFAIEVVETDEAAFPPESLKAHATTADKLSISSTVAMWLADRRISLADDFAGSLGYAISGPNGGAVVFDVDVEGVKVGEISFADSSGAAQTATFSTTAAAVEVVNVGERVELIAPANIQGMDDVAFTLQAWRS